MVTIATFPDLSAAYMLKAKLESENIPAFIPDESTVLMDWALINAIGGIRVQVPDEHAEQARQLIADYKQPG